MRVLSLVLTIVALQFNSAWAADEPALALTADSPNANAAEQSYVSDGGGVILDGRYIAPPYHVVAVADGVEVNGYFVPEAGFNDRSRRRGAVANRIPFADRILTRLNDGAWLLGWEEGEYGMLSESKASDILYVLASGSNRNEMLDELEMLETPWIERIDWRQLVDRCELPTSITDQYDTSLYYAAVNIDSELATSIHAPQRNFQASIYLLTVFGMGATVFALGTLLSYRPTEKMPWSRVNLSSDATQLVFRSVALLVGLAVLDLVCTTMSARTASFWELNPLGAIMLSTPLALGTFKIGVTLLSGTILVMLRRYHGAQVASWWLALFCTVLAIRWVTFNSMFLVA
ncbi:MAG: hypothetical protein WD070_09755 [Pirellulaceae bacterium]